MNGRAPASKPTPLYSHVALPLRSRKSLGRSLRCRVITPPGRGPGPALHRLGPQLFLWQLVQRLEASGAAAKHEIV